jgi:hypothetical protein
LKHKYGSKLLSRAATSTNLTDEKHLLLEQELSPEEKDQHRRAAAKVKQQQIRTELKQLYSTKRKEEKETKSEATELTQEEVFTPVYRKMSRA